MDLEGHTHKDIEIFRSMDVGGYKHNYEGFYEKSIYKTFRNRKTTTTQCAYVSLMRILKFLLFLYW